jgi:hypothetical protein
VTDASGNTATCSFTVTVTDNENPTITCPANIAVNNDAGVCGAAVTYTTPSFGDNCSGSTIAQTAGMASGSTFPKGTTTNTFVVTDASGNTATCSFTVTVSDNENPTITCPANIVVYNDSGLCGAIVTFSNPTFNDNCPGSSRVQTAGLPSGSVYPIGTTTNTFKVTDASGNTATCSFMVTVNFSTTTAVSYTLLANKEIHLHRNTVHGNVGIWTANKKVKIHKETDVYGFVKAPDIDLKDSSTISGAQITAQAPMPSNNFRYNTLPDTASNINVPDNYSGVYNLSGNVFKKIEVGKNSILNFTSSGDIYVREFKTKDADNSNYTQVRFTGNTNLIIKKKMELGKRTKFNQTGSYMVNVFVEEHDVKIDDGSTVTANIDVRFGKMDVDGKDNSPTIMNGYYIADNIDGKDYITWNGACQGPSTRSAGVKPGIASENFNFDVSVYPNPTKGDFNILVNSTSDAPVRATVYDIMGRILVANNNLKANVSIPVSKTLSNGMYLIRIDQNGVSQTIHLVKE